MRLESSWYAHIATRGSLDSRPSVETTAAPTATHAPREVGAEGGGDGLSACSSWRSHEPAPEPLPESTGGGRGVIHATHGAQRERSPDIRRGAGSPQGFGRRQHPLQLPPTGRRPLAFSMPSMDFSNSSGRTNSRRDVSSLRSFVRPHRSISCHPTKREGEHE